MYIEYVPIDQHHLQNPTAAAAAASASATTTFGGVRGRICGVGGSGSVGGFQNGGSGFYFSDGRKSLGSSRRCSNYSTTTTTNSSSNNSSVPMGIGILAKIRKTFQFGDNSERGRKRRAEGDWNNTSQFKYRRVESDFPKIYKRSLEEDDLNIIPQGLHKAPLVMAQRNQQIQKDKSSQFFRPETVIKQVPNTAFAEIEYSDDDEDDIIFTNGRGETFNVIRQGSGRAAVSRPTMLSTSQPKMINIPLKPRQPPPPLIEARTGDILASTLMPGLQPIRQTTYSSYLSAYSNGFDNAFTTTATPKVSTPKERNIPIRCETPHLYNGSAMGQSVFKRSIIAQENQSKDREKYSELLRKLVPTLYGIKGTSPKPTVPVKILPSALMNRSKAQTTIDLTEKSASKRKELIENTLAIDLSDDDDISEVIDLAEEELNILSACSKLQKDQAECSYDVKKRAAEKKNQLPYVEPVNSLKEKFDLSPFCKMDWLQNFRSKWDKKRVERRQELAETEKEVEERSAETRRKEKQMHERLKDLQIVDPDILVIDDFPEGEAEPEFPEITPEHESIIKAALFNGSPDQMLISKFNMSITRRDIATLIGNNWLNDEVINFYMNLLTERGEQRQDEGLPRVYAMNTFFVPKLQQSGHSGVRRWTRKVDIFAYDVIPVPVHVGGVHWCMAIIHLREHSIKYYDSMGTPNPRILNALEQYLREESLDKRKRPFDTSNFLIESVRDVPRQNNGSDCGVFSCMFAEYVSRGKEITFSQQHMEYFRHKMILEIVQGELMH